MPENNTQLSRMQHLRGTAKQWKAIGDTVVPYPGELVIELPDPDDENDNGLHRLKIGDGTTPYNSLPYLSTDNFVLPSKATVKIEQGNWKEMTVQFLEGDQPKERTYYYKNIEVTGVPITPKSRIDLRLTSDEFAKFYEENLAFMTENTLNIGGNIKLLCVGNTPSSNIQIDELQADVIEVVTDGSEPIYGNIVGGTRVPECVLNDKVLRFDNYSQDISEIQQKLLRDKLGITTSGKTYQDYDELAYAPISNIYKQVTHTFDILSVNNNDMVMKLSSIEGLAEGMECSCQYVNKYDLFGKIVSIDSENKLVTFDSIPPDTFSEGKINILWVPSNPDLGDSAIRFKYKTYSWTSNDSVNNKVYSNYAVALGTNTSAGSNAFKILAMDSNSNTIELNSVEGLKKDLKCSCQLKNNYDYFGTITDIDVDNKIVTFDVIPSETFDSSKTNTLWIPSNPELGDGETVVGTAAFVSGYENKANQVASAAFGYNNIAAGKYSFVANKGNIAGWNAFAIGDGTKALGNSALSAGIRSEASGKAAVALGYSTKATGEGSFAVGNSTQANGNNSFAFVSGSISHSLNTVAGGSSAQAYSPHCIALGYQSKAGNPSYIDPINVNYSSDEKYNGVGAISLGWGNEAKYSFSQAIGTHIITGKKEQIVLGKYNKISNVADFIIGNGSGTDNAKRNNCFELNDGKAYAYGEQLSTVKSGTSDLQLFIGLDDNNCVEKNFDSGRWQIGDYQDFCVDSFIIPIDDMTVNKNQVYEVTITHNDGFNLTNPDIYLIQGNYKMGNQVFLTSVFHIQKESESNRLECILIGDQDATSTSDNPIYLAVLDINRQDLNLLKTATISSYSYITTLPCQYTRHNNVVSIVSSGDIRLGRLRSITGFPYVAIDCNQYLDIINVDKKTSTKIGIIGIEEQRCSWLIDVINVDSFNNDLSPNNTYLTTIQGSYFI